MRSVVVVALLSGCWASPPPAAPPRDRKIALVVDQVELANGLKVVVVPDPSATNVSVTMRYGVGSLDDPPRREGLAHVVEHMMFEHVRDGEAIFDFLERTALGFSAYTTFDATVYNTRAPKDRLNELLALEQARMQQPCDAIPEAAFARQREIVRNELREREDADRIVHALHAGVFETVRPPASVETVASFTQREACAFAAANYTAANAVIVVAGPVTLRDVQPLVEQTLGTVKKPGSTPVRDAMDAIRGRVATVDAPTDRAWFVLAWPMPASRADRARVRMLVGMAVGIVRARVNGVVTSIELGAGEARHIAIAVAPSADVALANAIENAKDAIRETQKWFASGLFEHAKNRALHGLATSLEPAVERDARFAEDVAGGHTVRPTEELVAVSSMTRSEARDLVSAQLAPAKASVMTLRPSRRDAIIGGLAPVFHEHRRRRVEDPAEATRPATAVVSSTPFDRARKFELDSGLKVVLMPSAATLPTVDIRLVLPTGTSDETAANRGIATIAAHALEPAFDAQMFQFMQSGGVVERDVGFDHTELAVRGFAADLDLLLAGLAETVRNGAYSDDDVRETMASLRIGAHANSDDAIASSAWREALFGSGHPYRPTMDWQKPPRFEPPVLEQFRENHYRPRGATLLISGRFDEAAAERWVRYHFLQWSGSPTGRRETPARLRPLTFGQVQQTSQLSVSIAFAAPTNDSIALEIAVAMIEEAIADVRERIAASYGLRASVVPRRLSTTIEVHGAVDASRSREALALLRDRLAQLRERSDETAALFVSARRRVLTHMASSADVTTPLAAGRVPHTRRSIERARTMTIDAIAPLFEKLEVANAAILLRGPRRAIEEAFAAIGREPSMLE